MKTNEHLWAWNIIWVQNLRVRAEDREVLYLRGEPDPFALPRDSLMQRVNLLILGGLIFFLSLFFPFWVLVEVALEFVSSREVYHEAELYG